MRSVGRCGAPSQSRNLVAVAVVGPRNCPPVRIDERSGPQLAWSLAFGIDGFDREGAGALGELTDAHNDDPGLPGTMPGRTGRQRSVDRRSAAIGLYSY